MFLEPMDHSKPVLILGLGNAVLTDDAVGLHVARRVRELLGHDEHIEVKEAELAGFALVDLLAGYQRAVIVDAVRLVDHTPGEIVVHGVESFEPTLHLVSGHEIDLPTAVTLGHKMGYPMPREIFIVGVQVLDNRTLSETCTPQVQRAIEPAARRALEIARRCDPPV